MSSFQNKFCCIIRVKIKLLTAYHKETNSQTEIINQYINQRLRLFVIYFQDNQSELILIIDRVQITLPHSIIRIALYQLKYRVKPRNSQDQKSLKLATLIERLNIQEVVSVASRMHKAWQIAKENIKKAQERIAARVNKHQRSINQKLGDRVYLLTQNLKSYQLNHKLLSKFKGLYYVVEQVSYRYRLRLPNSLRIYNIFSLNVLKRYPNDPLPRQEPAKPLSKAIVGKEE